MLVHSQGLLRGAAQNFSLTVGLKQGVQPGGQGTVKGFAAASIGPANTVLDILKERGHEILRRRGVFGADLGPGNTHPPEDLNKIQELLSIGEPLSLVI
jgi:hypothetical protein